MLLSVPSMSKVTPYELVSVPALSNAPLESITIESLGTEKSVEVVLLINAPVAPQSSAVASELALWLQ